MDLIDALDRTFAHAHAVIAGVRADQYDDKTPCAEWTVRDLLGAHDRRRRRARRRRLPDERPSPFTPRRRPGRPAPDCRRAAMAGWRTPGVLDRIIDSRSRPMVLRQGVLHAHISGAQLGKGRNADGPRR